MTYRPGGFPEYSPQEQKIFDQIKDIIREVFELRNFTHIWTPAVESNKVLLKGGDSVSNEIFGLVGLKDFERSRGQIDKIENTLKDYSLRFDLTVPFARYVLDHLNELTFPFKRYQMQPVWRGERQQRGRFKEFRQCDIDSIWKSDVSVGYWYGIEAISTLQSAINEIFTKFSIAYNFTSHISHIGVTKKRLEGLLGDVDQVHQVVALLDKYYKKTHNEFMEDLTKIIGLDFALVIENLIKQKDYTILKNIDGYEQLHETIHQLNKLGCSIVYDVTIVRGLAYYTDIVFETFIEGEQGLGSICSGGGYQHFTDFIDPKQSFSGIGGSIGLSRLVEIVGSQVNIIYSDSYMIINFKDTKQEIIGLYQSLLQQNKICEIYPIPVKLGKQFEYADKKGITHCVILGAGELEQGIYKIKNLGTGHEETISLT